MRYSLSTAQGIVLISQQISFHPFRSPPSSGHWKALGQFICLSKGLWNHGGGSDGAPFSFTLGDSNNFVVSQNWKGHMLFSCVDIDKKQLNSDVQPLMLAMFLLQRFLNCMTQDSDGDKFPFLQFLDDLARRSAQGAEGSFADSVGEDQEDFLEALLNEHEVRDAFLNFEGIVHDGGLLSVRNPLYLRWIGAETTKEAANLRFPSALDVNVFHCDSSAISPLFYASLPHTDHAKQKHHSLEWEKVPLEMVLMDEMFVQLSKWWGNGDHAPACVSLSKGHSESAICIFQKLNKASNLVLSISGLEVDFAVAQEYHSTVNKDKIIFGLNTILTTSVYSFVDSLIRRLEENLML